MFGGYLYGNVSMMRVGAARAPGMTVADVDEQVFGLSDAPAYTARPDDRSLRCTLRLGRKTAWALLRPDRGLVDRDRRAAQAWIATLPAIQGAHDEQLVEIARRLPPKFEEMMSRLLLVSAFAGITRSTLDRLTSSFDDPSLVNRLTAGLGTIESAEPASALWELGRAVAALRGADRASSTTVSTASSRGFAADPLAVPFLVDLDRFRDTFGCRGPDEWELASPTWGTEPAIALAAIERLRQAPDERDPAGARRRLAAERHEATTMVLHGLRPPLRALFRRTLASALVYARGPGGHQGDVRSLPRTGPSRRCTSWPVGASSTAATCSCSPSTSSRRSSRAPERFAATLTERAATRDDLQARVPPFWFEGEIPPPSTWPLRTAQARRDPAPRMITGIGVCAGVATGTARVVTDPAEPGALEPGDILVAPITDPAWTPLFLAVAGVVVDVGAQQSHAAIIAREARDPGSCQRRGSVAHHPRWNHHHRRWHPWHRHCPPRPNGPLRGLRSEEAEVAEGPDGDEGP